MPKRAPVRRAVASVDILPLSKTMNLRTVPVGYRARVRLNRRGIMARVKDEPSQAPAPVDDKLQFESLVADVSHGS